MRTRSSRKAVARGLPGLGEGERRKSKCGSQREPQPPRVASGRRCPQATSRRTNRWQRPRRPRRDMTSPPCERRGLPRCPLPSPGLDSLASFVNLASLQPVKRTVRSREPSICSSFAVSHPQAQRHASVARGAIWPASTWFVWNWFPATRNARSSAPSRKWRGLLGLLSSK